MTCPTDETLVLFADSDGNEPAPELSAHLESCAACAERVGGLRLALGEWRSIDLVDTSSYRADYFATMTADIERALDLSDSQVDPHLVPGPALWWRRPLLAAALAAAVLLAVGLLRNPPQTTTDAALASARSLEEVARELGRSLLDEESEDGLLDEETSLTFLAAWDLSQADGLDDLPPLPLTTTLADEFDLLSTEQVDSLIKRL
jgi:hypothetical protein